MFKPLSIIVALIGSSSASAQDFSEDFQTDLVGPAVVFNKMQTYCRSCHGVSPLRFFHSEDPNEFMNQLCTGISPITQKPWAQQIIKVLSWPSDSAPDPGQVMEPPSRDWMPRGAKRAEFALDTAEGTLTRKALVDAIRERCALLRKQ